MSYELHPETPPEGVPLSERFKGMDLTSFYANLQARGSELGIVFNRHTLLSNSRMALMASEYARDMERYDAFHENMFHAYMTEAQDIGRMDVVAAVAQKSGLDVETTIAAVQDGRYAGRLTESAKQGRLLGLTGIPLFIVNNKYKIVGAQPIDVFRAFLEKIK